jgi:hypothetical protein
MLTSAFQGPCHRVVDGGVLVELVAAQGIYNTCVESVQHLLQGT